jgi:sensor histidine kinase YesM
MYRMKAHHVLFWVAYVVFWVNFFRGAYDFRAVVINTLFYAVFNGAAFYIIGYLLFPRYLYRRRYGIFFALLVMVVLVSSAGLGTVLYMVMKGIDVPYEVRFSAAFTYALTAICTTVGLLTAAKLVVEKIRSDINVRHLDRQRLETELQYLRAQVNPHFLFNAINSVYFLIRKDPDKASETLIKLSDLLRFQLYDCTDEKIPIEKELEYIQNFIELEKLRKGNKVTVNYREEGMLSGFPIAPFMLIPFLENAFKFISNHSDKRNEISISLARQNGQFTATFFNTCERAPKNSVGGIGLKNVKRRLDLIYPGSYQLTVDEKNDTYCVTLSLNIA